MSNSRRRCSVLPPVLSTRRSWPGGRRASRGHLVNGAARVEDGVARRQLDALVALVLAHGEFAAFVFTVGVGEKKRCRRCRCAPIAGWARLKSKMAPSAWSAAEVGGTAVAVEQRVEDAFGQRSSASRCSLQHRALRLSARMLSCASCWLFLCCGLLPRAARTVHPRRCLAQQAASGPVHRR